MSENLKTNQKKVWEKETLEHLLNGKWIVEPREDWCCWDMAINESGCAGEGTLFIAIDEDRWHQESGSTGIYAGWSDTHITLPKFQHKVVGAVVERHIEALDPSIPQLLVKNSYEVISILAAYVRGNYTGKVIAITGTFCKSATKTMLHHLLEGKGEVESTNKNHSFSIGVPLTLARGIKQPDYIVLEIAISALGTRSDGICRLVRPHISIITEIDLGQSEDNVKAIKETARMRARIAQGIEPGGIAILNRDMEEYDLVKSEVKSYGAIPMSYGFHEDADFRVVEWRPKDGGLWVTAKIQDQELRYYLPASGKRMISSSLAALSALYALGTNPSEVLGRFSSIQLNDSVLETLTVDLPKGGKVRILDGSYNATALSMTTALEVFKANSSAYQGKKVCILGRIASLGENAERIHRQLAKPLIESGVNMVFAYGDEMKYLIEELPEHMVGGFYSDIGACARGAANVLEPDDYILLKGSRGGNDFGRIRSFLLNAIKNPEADNQIPNVVKYENPHFSYGVQAIDAESEEVLLTEGDPLSEVDQGIGGVLLLCLLIERIILGEIKLNDYITIGAVPFKDFKSAGAIGLREGERVSVHTLLSAVICQNAPDAMLALSEKLAGSTNKALEIMKSLSNMLELSESSVENITGRVLPSKKQSFNLSDLTKVGLLLFSFPMAYLKMLNITTMEFNGKIFSLSSNLIASGKAFGGYLFGKISGEGTVLSLIKGRKVILSVCGARDSFHRDYLLTKAIDQLTFSSEEVNRVSVKEKFNIMKDNDIKINILGDTYFGEDYTIRRQKRGEEDALTKYGYDYSFKGIEALLKTGDLNIANFEAALTDDLASSPLQGIKPNVFGGKIEESISTLKKFNIHAVTLGNNHAMDYGVDGLNSTLEAFETSRIQYIGAGYNCKDASEPMHIQIGNYEIIIFNGYWYTESEHHVFESYALGIKPGVACLNGELTERIREEKQKSADSFVITIAHWGSGFGNVLPLQRTYAKQLIESGTDLIIGHGTHMMQEIQQINGKWVFFGIGNGVFNTNDEYDEKNAPPYSFFLQIRIKNSKARSIFLYPLFSDNLKTFWQTHPVTQDQFKDVINYQNKNGTSMEKLRIGADEFGNFIEIPLT